MSKYEENSPVNTKAREGGEGCASGVGTEIPLHHMEKTMIKQFVLYQPMEDPILQQVGMT